VNKIREGGGFVDGGWLLDNIDREMDDGSSTLIWRDPWLDEVSINVRYCRLYDLAENKMMIVVDMNALDWGVNGEAWKWRRRLFA